MRLQTRRLVLRPFEERDVKPFAVINSDPEVMRYFPSTRNLDETRELIDWANAGLVRNGFGFLAVDLIETGEFVGLLGLSRLDDDYRDLLPGRPEVEIGWRLARNVWGQGLAPEGARACLHYAWTVLDLPEVVAFTFKGNQPSRRVMEKIGMTRNPADDFDHAKVDPATGLHPHVLYRTSRRP